MSDEPTVPVHDLFDEQVEKPTDTIGERLQKRRQEIAANRFVDLDVPGYDGALFGRYVLLNGDRLNRIAENVRKTIKDQTERGIAAACDTLIAALEEFYVRDGGRELPVREVMDVAPAVRYDRNLAAFLGFGDELGDQAQARTVVLKLFVENEIAIAGHNLQLSRWMLQNGTDISTELLESGEL